MTNLGASLRMRVKRRLFLCKLRHDKLRHDKLRHDNHFFMLLPCTSNISLYNISLHFLSDHTSFTWFTIRSDSHSIHASFYYFINHFTFSLFHFSHLHITQFLHVSQHDQFLIVHCIHTSFSHFINHSLFHCSIFSHAWINIIK